MRRPRGFTMVEVLIALVIMSIVTGAIYQLLNRTQRLSLAQTEQVSLQSNVRTGSLIVPNELRELNTWLGAGIGPRNDIIAAEADAITYRAMRGMGFVCEPPGPTELRLAASSWTGLRDPVAARDSLYLFIDGNPNDDDDDGWLQVDITGVASPANACAGAPGFILTVDAVPAVPLNTPVRVFEVMELKLYQPDGSWWLGARSVAVEANLQPVLGPLTDDGFQLEYLNGAGAITADLSAIQSVRVVVQGLTDDAVRAHGTAALGHPEETLSTQVLLRNSIRP